MEKKRVYGSMVTLEFMMEPGITEEEKVYYDTLLEKAYNALANINQSNDIEYENKCIIANIISRYISSMIDEEYRDKVTSVQKVYNTDKEIYEYVLVIFDVERVGYKAYIVSLDEDLQQYYIEIDE